MPCISLSISLDQVEKKSGESNKAGFLGSFAVADEALGRFEKGWEMLNDLPLIVGIGGTTRPGSTSEMALAAALEMARGMGVRTKMLSGAALVMETYEPGVIARSANASEFIAALREADGVLIASPSYHGSVSGLLKNAIDYVEDMRSDSRPYFDGRAVGCIVCADGAQALGSTLFSLRSIIHALRGWPTPYAAAFNSMSKPFGQDGKVREPDVERQLRTVVGQVVEFAQAARLACNSDMSLKMGAH